jgi:hypothetical protein
MLSGTDKRVSNEDLKSKLLSSLPSTDYWHGVKVKATEDQKDLQATITSLMSYQRPKPTPITASVAANIKDTTNKGQGERNTRNSQRGGRGAARARGRGGRNRGRGGGRGNAGHRGGRSESRDDHEDRVQKDYSKDRLSAD